ERERIAVVSESPVHRDIPPKFTTDVDHLIWSKTPVTPATLDSETGMAMDYRPPITQQYTLNIQSEVARNKLVEFRAEFFNLFNKPQFSNPDTNFSSSTFGQISSTSVNPRFVQFALKLTF